MEKTIKLLSVDFDYFVDADIDTRDTNFPQGIDDTNENYLKQWEMCYEKYPDISKIGINEKEFEALWGYLVNRKTGSSIVSCTHKDLYPWCDHFLSEGYTVEVTNVDFHHDMFDYARSEEEVNCGNWAKKLKEKYPDTFKYTWLGAPSSETRQLGGEDIPMTPMTLEEVLSSESFGAIFMCLSSAWTPPHLDFHFMQLMGALGNFCVQDVLQEIHKRMAMLAKHNIKLTGVLE